MSSEDMKTIQCLTVMMMMMTVMIYAVPLQNVKLPKDVNDTALDIMKDIHDAALNMSTQNKTLNVRVTKIGQDGGSACVKMFFCLAEKSLENAANKHQLHGQTLIRHLKSFNKIGNTHCQLDTNNGRIYFKKFLEDIITCADHWMIEHNHQ